MEAVELIELYGTLFYVFLGITLLGLVLAVFFFFYFDIPAVRAMITGKARQETIRRMEEKNAKTGNLRFQYPGYTADMSRGGLTGRVGGSRRLDRTGRTGKTGQTGTIRQDRSGAAQPVQSEPETALLQNAAPETALLSRADAQPQLQKEEDSGRTAMLHRNDPGFLFEVTQSTVVVHTDEFI